MQAASHTGVAAPFVEIKKNITTNTPLTPTPPALFPLLPYHPQVCLCVCVPNGQRWW